MESSLIAFNYFNSAVIFLTAIGIIVTFYECCFRSLKSTRMGNKMPGPFSIPLLGNAHLAIGKSPTEVFAYIIQLYYSYRLEIIRIWGGPNLYVGLSNPDDIELILASDNHLEKPKEYKLFEPWLGDGLLISKGEKWRSHRKMIVPTFHASILKTFMPVFNKNANNLVKQLENEIGKLFDVHDYMSGVTVDTLLETAMGVRKSKEDNTGIEYAKAVMDMCNILHLRHYKFWLRSDFLFRFTKMSKVQSSLLKIIHKVSRQAIQRKKKDFFSKKSSGQESLYEHAIKASGDNVTEGKIEEKPTSMRYYARDDLDEIDENDVGEKKRQAFLDFMIEASNTKGNILSDEEIRDEVNTIMFEGHDTTAAAASFTLCLLGIYKDIQDKVVEELKEIFQDNFYRPVTFNDTTQMKYLERVIFESIRMYPPVPAIARIVHEDIKLVSGDYTIPSGTTVVIAQWAVHRNPKYYENPNTFDPDNFLPEKCQNRPYHAYIPFSAGPRSCVGRKYAMLKLKVILATVLRRFQVTSIAKEADFKLQADIILKRADGFNIQVENRVL